jgi:tetratricopeptide (TPR) repeat protein
VPQHALARQFLRNGYWTRAQALNRLKRHAEVLADCDRALELPRGQARDFGVFGPHMLRADSLDALGRYAEALADRDRALELAPVELREDFRVDRALTLARMGDHARATTEVVGVSQSAPNLYNSACVYALSSAARQDTNRPPAGWEATAAGYAARAVALLDQARQAGYFEAPANLKNLVSDPDLDPLRSRADFRLLMFDVVFPADVFAPK